MCLPLSRDAGVLLPNAGVPECPHIVRNNDPHFIISILETQSSKNEAFHFVTLQSQAKMAGAPIWSGGKKGFLVLITFSLLAEILREVQSS